MARPRSALAVSEIALSLMLLAAAGLLVRSFIRLRAVSPGFRQENVLVFQLSLAPVPGANPAAELAFFRGVVERIEALPGVIAAGATDELPFGSWRTTFSFEIEGRTWTPDMIADVRSASPHYFRAMGVPLLRGRAFTEADNAAGPPVAIINERMASRFWPGESAVGKFVMTGSPQARHEIVGVVGNVQHGRLRDEFTPEIYEPWTQHRMAGTAGLLGPNREMGFAVQAVGEPAMLIPAIRNVVHELDRSVPVYAIRPIGQAVSESISADRFNTLLLAVFAGVALLLAAIGTYGVIAHSVEQRRHEIGIRMALGAQRRDVLALVLRQGLALTILGLALGLAAALAVTRVLAGMLYGITPTDAGTFAGVVGLLALVALLATYIPARRATRLDPMAALRYE